MGVGQSEKEKKIFWGFVWVLQDTVQMFNADINAQLNIFSPGGKLHWQLQ